MIIQEHTQKSDIFSVILFIPNYLSYGTCNSQRYVS